MMWLDAQVSAGIPEILQGLWVTVELTFLAALFSVVVSHGICFLLLSKHPLLHSLGLAYVSIMRGTPAIVQLFVVFFTLPKIGLGGQPMLAAVLAIGMNSAAYVAEILRVNRRLMTWWYVITPQVIKGSLPMLVNEFTLVLKTTPLASVVALTELTYAGQVVIARSYEATQVLLLVAAGYLLVALPLVYLARYCENSR